MICPNCKQEYEGNFCSNCGYSSNAPQPAVVIQQVPQKKKNSGCLIALIIPAAVIIAFIIAVNTAKSDDEKSNSPSDSMAISEEIITNEPATTTGKTDSKSENTTNAKETTETTTAPEEDIAEESYESNSYYDIVEQSAFKDFIGYTHIVQKVQAKKDGTVEGTVIAYFPEGSVIGKSEDTIYLCESEYNYFEYTFNADLTDAVLSTSVKTKNSITHDGDKDAVEMTDYSVSPQIIGATVYVTFKQVGEIGAFSEYKLLFYKGDKIVNTNSGHFSVYASNLTGPGSTDVAEIMVTESDFDRVEFIYEK